MAITTLTTSADTSVRCLIEVSLSNAQCPMPNAQRGALLTSGLLLQVPVQQVFHKFDAPELHYHRVWLYPTVERQADLPGPGKRLRVLDCGLIVERIRAARGEPLHHMQCIAVKISSAIEPALVVEPLG